MVYDNWDGESNLNSWPAAKKAMTQNLLYMDFEEWKNSFLL